MKDACGRILAPIDSTKTGNPTCNGDVVYTYIYKDCAGNQNEWTYTYHIQKTAPTIVADGIESSKNITCIDDAIVPTVVPTAKNSCGEEIAATSYDRKENWTDGKENCVGTITYTYTYIDCDLESTWDYVYTLNNNVPIPPVTGNWNPI